MKKTIKYLLAVLVVAMVNLPLQAQKSGRRLADALLVEAVQYMEDGKWQAAEVILQKAYAVDPENDAVNYYRGYISAMKNDAKGALEGFEKAAALDSTNIWYQRRLAGLYLLVGKGDKSVVIYRRLLEKNRMDLDLMTRLADAYIDQEQYKSADSLITVIENTWGGNEYTALSRLDLLFAEGKYDEYFDGMDNYFRESPSPGSAKCDMINQLIKKCDPRFNSFHINDYVRLTETCLLVHPSDTAVIHFAAGVYYSLGNGAKIKELSEAYPEDIVIAEIEMAAYFKNEDFKAALECLDRMEKLAGDDKKWLLQIHTSRGDCYQHLGRNDATIREYEAALRIDPDNILVLNNYSYFLCCNNKNLGKCLKMSKRVIELEPENAIYLDTYAWILYKKKNYREAKLVMKKAMMYGGKEQAEILEHYAAILEALGENALAEGYRNQAELKRSNAKKN